VFLRGIGAGVQDAAHRGRFRLASNPGGEPLAPTGSPFRILILQLPLGSLEVSVDSSSRLAENGTAVPFRIAFQVMQLSGCMK
jgi:hypothetical protein